MNGITSAAAPPIVHHPKQISWFPIAVFALVWLELISRLRFEWTLNPQYSYGWIVPILAAYFFWRRYRTAPTPSRPTFAIIAQLFIIIGAILLIPVRLIQESSPDWRLLGWTMALATGVISAGGVYLSGGKEWLRHFAFPILFFFVAVPWPTQLEQFVIQGLMRVDAFITVEVLNVVGIPALQLGNVIEVGSGLVGIDEACTGIRSLQATLMVSLFLGELYELSVLRRIFLVVAGACLAFFCNLVRTFLLVWLEAKNGSETIKTWHDPAGYTILGICLTILWGLSLFLKDRDKAARAISHQPVFRIPRFVLGILLVSLVVAEAGTQIWYRARESNAAQLEPWTVAWPVDAANWKTVAIADSAQELLRYSDGGGGGWTGDDGHNWNIYFFRWLPGRTAGLFVKNHRPDICLPASGMKQQGAAQNKFLTVNNVRLPIRSYVFENNGRPLHVYYCYWDGTAEAGVLNEDWTPSGRLKAAWKGKRDVGTQMLEIVGWDYDDDEKAENAALLQLSKIIRRD
ncbi:MAG TPA: exosortase/archaeosortase family protein [Chthoniobacterales bacterium]|nr:exosortase/archaeosortase family protein [Chthoniobacterales bacterium]